MLKRIKNLFKFKQKEEESPSVYERIDNLYDALNDDIILVKIGEDLIPHGDFICNIISDLRDEIKDECGFIFQAARVVDISSLQENEFVICINGEDVKNGFLIPNENGIKEEFYETFKTVIYDYLETLFTNEVTERYIDTVQRKNGWLVWNLTNVLSIIDIKTIMLDIIQKGKSINNINYIFEQIGKQVLTEGKYRDCFVKHNPHIIAKEIIEQL